MNDIRRVVRAAAWRVGAIAYIRNLVVALAVVLAGLIVLRIAEQVFAFTAMVGGEGMTSVEFWKVVAIWSSAGAAVVALVWTLFTLADRKAVARRVDEGANLREAISTAMYIEHATDPWSKATVESAARSARGVRLSQAVPIQPPRFWPVPLALGLALAVVFLALPRMDVLGWYQNAMAKKEVEEQRTIAVAEQRAVEKLKQDTFEKLGLEPDEPAAEPGGEKPEPSSPEEIRRAALKDLTRLADRLEQLKQGEKGQKLETLKDKLGQLQRPGDELADLSKALQAGDFKQARAELQKMQEQAAAGNLSEEDKQKLAEQLKKMAEQLEKLAQNKEQLEKKLQEAGLDPSLANATPEQVKEALEKAENLSPEQKQQLEQMCNSQSQCQSAMESLAGAVKSAASEMAQSGEGQQGSMGELGDQLSQLEQLAMEMEMADAALSECKAQMQSLCQGGECEGMGECAGGMPGTKPWAAGYSQNQGMGSGGPGQGRGGEPGEAAADFETVKRKAIGPQGEGPIVGSRLVEGDSIKGESKAAFAQVVATADQAATDAIEQNAIPREFHEAVKAYFGTLKEKGGGKPAAPAQPAQDADKK
ncbi:MAG: hypothetical protein KF699_12570 [Phycisphaeraceae bacterium]|nr:hypothetical protein [Phycisphaeraceae bacterium]